MTHCRDSGTHDNDRHPRHETKPCFFASSLTVCPCGTGPLFTSSLATAIATNLEQPSRGLAHISPSRRKGEKVQGESILSRDTTSKRCFLLHLVPSSICHGIWFVVLRDQSNGKKINLGRLTCKLPGRLVIGSSRRSFTTASRHRCEIGQGKTRQDKTGQYLLKQEYGKKMLKVKPLIVELKHRLRGAWARPRID